MTAPSGRGDPPVRSYEPDGASPEADRAAEADAAPCR